MLKRKITNEQYAALADVLKAEYKPNGTEYVLDTDDATDLINARNDEKRQKDQAVADLGQAKARIKELETSGSDWVSTENRYKADLAAKDAELANLNTQLTNATKIIVAGPVAEKIASKFTAPSLVKKEIMARLDVDPKTKEVRVLDATGKVSSQKVEELEKEFVDNPEYKGIVIGSRASGSATGPGTGGSAPKTPTNPDGSSVKLADMSPADLAAHMKAKREAANQQT
jgi:hypothetical protein